MKELIKISDNNGQKVVSARELQTFLGASERFLNWFDRQLQYGFMQGTDYIGCKVFNALANQELTDFALTIDCAKEISMLQRTEKGKQARQYFIEMEKVAKKGLVQLPDFNNPAIAARAWADQYEKRELAEGKVKQLQPKAESYDRFLDSDKYMTIADVAKTLHYENAGPNQLFEILRKHGILSKQPGKNWNLPHQEYLDQKLFVVKKTEKEINGDVQYFSTTYVTAKGLERINVYLRKLGYAQAEL
jgi:anti-repressor protein